MSTLTTVISDGELSASVHPPLSIGGGSSLTPTVFRKSIKWLRCPPLFPQPLCSSPQFSSPTSKTSGLVPLLSVLRHTIMFPKAALTFLVVGALSVNALTIPVVQRSPAPEPECEFTLSFSTTSYHDLTFVSIVQELEAWMLKRDLAYDLFSREPMDWDYMGKREPSPGGGNTPVPPYPNPSSPRPASPEPGKPGPVPRPLPPNHL